MGIALGPRPLLEHELVLDDVLDVRSAMADWDARFHKWCLEQMRQSDNAETRRLGATCNCRICLPRSMPGRGRVGFG